MTAKQLDELYILNDRISETKKNNEHLRQFIVMAEKSIESDWAQNAIGGIWKDLLKLIYPKHIYYFSFEVLDKKTLLQILQIAYDYNNSKLKELENEFKSITVVK